MLLLQDHLQKSERSNAMCCHLEKCRTSGSCCSLRTTYRRKNGTSVTQPAEQGISFCAKSGPLAAVRLPLVDHLQGARQELLCDERQQQQQGCSVSSI